MTAVDHALAFRVQDRPQSIAAWRTELPPPVEADVDTADWDSATAPTLAVDGGAPTLAVTLATTHANLASAPPADRGADASCPVDAGITTRTRARIGRRHYAMGLLAMVLSALLLGAWLGKRVIDTPLERAPALLAKPSLPPVANATRTSPPSTPVASDDATASTPASITTPAEQVALLLFGASDNLADLRLLSPPGQNAYEKYRQVLAIEPDNAAARAGLVAISERYIALAYREMDAHHLERAQTYLSNAATAAPDRAALNTARDALAARRMGVPPPSAASNGAPIIEMSTRAADKAR